MTKSSGVIEAPPPILNVELIVTDIVGLDMTNAVSKVHLEAFQGYLNAGLGSSYARTLIQWYVEEEAAIALAAIDRHQQVIGYVIGGPVALAKKVRSDMFWITAQSIILHPWLVFDRRLWKMGRARIAAKRGPEKTNRMPELALPTFSLRGIGVKSSHRQKGVGKLLLRAFEEKARMLNAKSLVLWVYSDKTAPRRLYEKCGWQPFPTSIQNTGSMKYVRVLDQPSS